MNANSKDQHLMVNVLSYVQNIVMDRMKTKRHKYEILIIQLSSIKLDHPIHIQ